ncbi:MAG TPA: TonB-dependent receptor plug domain-containing protein [Longimicrobium sp.]|nr:TonB-dependent receptor plug domain-containing protein [Longimicrobium sp.]
MALPASAHPAPRPAPITQVLVEKAGHGVIPAAQRMPTARIYFRCAGGSSSAVRPAAFLVDGRMFTSAEFNRMQVDPGDITHVVVLKATEAVAIYGEAAANGVVILTTRRGAGGR